MLEQCAKDYGTNYQNEKGVGGWWEGGGWDILNTHITFQAIIQNN